MHTIKFSFLLSLLLAGALAQAQLSDPAALQFCAKVKDVQLPAQDRPSSEETKALEKCLSQELYFGFGKAPDYTAARKCAYLEMDRNLKDAPFSGKTILMMVYANGRGAAQNLDVAIKLACEVPGAPGDWAGRIHQLERMRKSSGASNFDFCDHSSDRYWYEQCALLGDRPDKIQREQRLDAIQAKWDRDEKRAFQSLRMAARRYFHLRATKETDLTMTFEVQELALLENTFIEMLDQAVREDVPKATKEDMQKAEADMGGAFAQTQNGKKTLWGTVTAEDIKTTQIAWTAYREAWIAFGKVKYPKVSDESWKTWLALQRREMLEKFMH